MLTSWARNGFFQRYPIFGLCDCNNSWTLASVCKYHQIPFELFGKHLPVEQGVISVTLLLLLFSVPILGFFRAAMQLCGHLQLYESGIGLVVIAPYYVGFAPYHVACRVFL